MDIEYSIWFDGDDVPNRVACVTVKLDKKIVKPEEIVRLDLVNHPLYPYLRAYVLANL